MATLLAQQAKSSVVFDLKPGLGDLAPLLDVKPTHTLADLCLQPTAIDRVVFERSLTRHASGVHLLAPPRTLAEIVRVTPKGVRQALSIARTLFDGLTANPPELLDAANAPLRAPPRGSDRLAGDDHGNRVSVQLREVPDRQPAAAVDPQGKSDIVRVIVGRHLLGGGHMAVDDQLDSALASASPGLLGWARSVQIHRVSDQTVAAGRGQGAVRDSYRRVGREGDLGPDCHGFGLCQRHLTAGGLAATMKSSAWA